MLFFCSWEARRSVVIDAANEAAARKNATTIAEGEAPRHVATVPSNVFACEVYEDDEDDDAIVLEPLEHTEILLGTLEADGENVGGPMVEIEPCGADALDDADQTVTCIRHPRHSGKHISFGGLEWD